MYGDTEHGSFMAGQIAGMIDRIQPAAEIILEMFSQAELLDLCNWQNDFRKRRGFYWLKQH